MITCRLVYKTVFHSKKRVFLGKLLKFDEVSLIERAKKILKQKVAAGERIMCASIECEIEVPEVIFQRDEILKKKLWPKKGNS